MSSKDQTPLSCEGMDLTRQRYSVCHQPTLYGISRLDSLTIDCALVIVLVKLWRQKTHTFHRRVGDDTLQAVAILLGLLIDGRAIASPVMSDV